MNEQDKKILIETFSKELSEELTEMFVGTENSATTRSLAKSYIKSRIAGTGLVFEDFPEITII